MPGQEDTSLKVVGLNPFYHEISVEVNLYDLLVVESVHFFRFVLFDQLMCLMCTQCGY